MQRIAIPVENGVLSEYFNVCQQYQIFEIVDKTIKNTMVEQKPDYIVGDLPAWISNRGITDIIVYKIDKQIIKLFFKYKINLYVGISKNNPQLLIEDYLNGNLRSDEQVIEQIMM